ncbi:MAG TPA: M56 family metallopeptidase, partial [Gemmatimonadales bacterium]|nr:M56 family metallopeptidase [Gemmatimonadales bacterium]
MTAIQVVGWTLIHFVWQGALIAAALALALAVTGKRSPTIRYGLGLAAMLTMAAWPLATGVRLWRTGEGMGLGLAGVVPMVEQGVAVAESQTVGEGAGRAEMRQATRTASPGPFTPAPLGTQWSALAQQGLDRAVPWLVLAWMSGVVLLSLRLLGGWAWARRLTRVGAQAPAEALQATLRRLQAAMRISPPVRLLESTLVQVPAVIGWLRPSLLVPVSAATGLSPQQLEVLLAHE